MTAGSIELPRVRHLLDDLDRTVRAAEQLYGQSLEVRRVRADLDHLRESFSLLSEAYAAQGSTARPMAPVPIPDTPYDPSLWQDAEDEGVGSQSRHRD
jgi:hypothetical protein